MKIKSLWGSNMHLGQDVTACTLLNTYNKFDKLLNVWHVHIQKKQKATDENILPV